MYSKILILKIDFTVSGNSLACYCIDTLKQNSSKIATSVIMLILKCHHVLAEWLSVDASHKHILFVSY